MKKFIVVILSLLSMIGSACTNPVDYDIEEICVKEIEVLDPSTGISNTVCIESKTASIKPE